MPYTLARTLSVTTPALLLSGVMLILLGPPAGGSPPETYIRLLSSVVPVPSVDAGNGRDIARFVVLLVGVALLAGLMHFRWERESSDGTAEAYDS